MAFRVWVALSLLLLFFPSELLAFYDVNPMPAISHDVGRCWQVVLITVSSLDEMLIPLFPAKDNLLVTQGRD